MMILMSEISMKKIFDQKIDYVYHAASYKHVPLLEYNISSALKNNILGTWNVLNLSYKYNIKKFILISSDKAVRPTNIMGITKRFSEICTLTIKDKFQNSSTSSSIVRFGNVLGSSGSVIPLFLSQLKENKPLTVTHPSVTRYFMTIKDAVGLVLQASYISSGGEIFVLDMGQPVKIDTIAKKLVQLSGVSNQDLNKNIDKYIKYIGLRPGEKMHEELFIDSNKINTEHPNIFIAKEDHIEYSEIIDIINILSENENIIGEEITNRLKLLTSSSLI